MIKALQEYWEEMYAEFQIGDGIFFIPDFPHPLLSARFIYDKDEVRGEVCNLIGEAQGLEIIFESKLHIFGKVQDPSVENAEVQVEPLSEALLKKGFWEFIEENHDQGKDFLESLFPFLSQRPYPHYHYFILQDGKLVASLVAGDAPSGRLYLNALVKRSLRGRGFSNLIFSQAERRRASPRAMFWTRHPWFNLGAQTSFPYVLCKRKESS